MLSYLLIWILVFALITSVGLLVIRLLRISKAYQSLEFIFFSGFATLSLVTSYASIFTAIDRTFFSVIAGAIAIGIFFIRDEVKVRLREISHSIKQLKGIERIVCLCLLGVVLLQVVKPIKTFDTGLYHTQSIIWIQSFEVVPGLGNLHHRFAFNSMFFPISALLSFEMPFSSGSGSALLYPLNSIAFLVFLIAIGRDIKKASMAANKKEAVFLFILGLLCFHFLAKHVNSPSPDVITGLLVLFTLQFLRKQINIPIPKNVLGILSCLVFLSITYKLSAFFLSLILLPFVYKKGWRYSLYAAIAGCVVVAPYLVRNYYLSGYLIFPLASIDILSVDWKLPIEKAVLESNWITSWARIPQREYTEVMAMKPWEWIPIWFFNLKIISKIVVLSQLVLMAAAVKDLWNKKYLDFYSKAIVLVSVIFWFVKAPDVRFAYGFLIMGTALVAGKFFGRITWPSRFVTKLNDGIASAEVQKYLGIVMILVLSIFISLKISTYGLLPSEISEIDTRVLQTNFSYYVPTTSAQCYNQAIPCTPYPKATILLRGETLEDGFQLGTKQE